MPTTDGHPFLRTVTSDLLFFHFARTVNLPYDLTMERASHIRQCASKMSTVGMLILLTIRIHRVHLIVTSDQWELQIINGAYVSDRQLR